MDAEPPIPRDLWGKIPPDAQAAVLALVQSFERRTAALEARLGQDSSNSSEPPSSDPIHIKRRPPRPPSGKKRGGQRGHERHTRALVSPERLTAAVGCKPPACLRCGHRLKGNDPEPARHQVAEQPEVCPDVIEYLLIGSSARAVGPRRGAYGPRLQATIGLLTGAYRLSKRQVSAVLAD
jgi:transposase